MLFFCIRQTYVRDEWFTFRRLPLCTLVAQSVKQMTRASRSVSVWTLGLTIETPVEAHTLQFGGS